MDVVPEKPVSAASFAAEGVSLAAADARLRGRSSDPVAAILGTEGQGGFDWFYAGLVVAFALHAFILGFAIAGYYLHEIRDLMLATRANIHEFFWTQYDVDLAPKDKPPPKQEAPPPPAEPEPLPVPKAATKIKDDPYDQPPPTPAQAAKVLTQKEDPDKVEDLTGNTVVSGEGTALGGQQSAAGKGDQVVHNPAASLSGVPSGRGTGTAPPPPPPPPPGPDLSRAADLAGSKSWHCDFPPEADADQIDQETVTIMVTVRPDGSALSVTVVKDPGHGFGRAARMCALAKRYTPPLDRKGAPITGPTPPIIVRFTR
jgi:periplasmic protein TonB